MIGSPKVFITESSRHLSDHTNRKGAQHTEGASERCMLSIFRFREKERIFEERRMETVKCKQKIRMLDSVFFVADFMLNERCLEAALPW